MLTLLSYLIYILKKEIILRKIHIFQRFVFTKLQDPRVMLKIPLVFLLLNKFAFLYAGDTGGRKLKSTKVG
jgi:hypothetical protein